jgi:hypothetical protein
VLVGRAASQGWKLLMLKYLREVLMVLVYVGWKRKGRKDCLVM